MTARPRARRLAGLGASACIVALAVLSLLPKSEMIRTGADGRLEHAIAYAGTMALCALAWSPPRTVSRIAAALIAYAGLLELGQHLSPGRSPAAIDFAAGAAGTIVAALACAVLARR